MKSRCSGAVCANGTKIIRRNSIVVFISLLVLLRQLVIEKHTQFPAQTTELNKLIFINKMRFSVWVLLTERPMESSGMESKYSMFDVGAIDLDFGAQKLWNLFSCGIQMQIFNWILMTTIIKECWSLLAQRIYFGIKLFVGRFQKTTKYSKLSATNESSIKRTTDANKI